MITSIEIAKFAYGAYEFINSREDDVKPKLDLIITLLNQINTKLDVINDKLDLIYFELKQLPNKIEYNHNISLLNGVLEELKPFYNTLKDFIIKYGEIQGKNKFLEIHTESAELYLDSIRQTCQRLEKHHDPITTIYISTCVKIDLELSTLIKTDPITIKNRLKDYLIYFTSTTLPRQIKIVRKGIEKWRKHESLLNRADPTNDLEGLKPIIALSLYFYELKPQKIKDSEFSSEQLKLVQLLLNKELLKKEDLNIKRHYKATYLGQAAGYMESHLHAPYMVKLIEKGFIRPGINGLLSHGFSRTSKDGTFTQLYLKKLNSVNKEYAEHFYKLLSYLSAYNTSKNVKRFLVNRIAELEN